jgi:hypothetical protein
MSPWTTNDPLHRAAKANAIPLSRLRCNCHGFGRFGISLAWSSSSTPALKWKGFGVQITYSTSRIISISTGMLKGNSAMPTAERACLPIASPKTSTIRSEKPLMTFG